MGEAISFHLVQLSDIDTIFECQHNATIMQISSTSLFLSILILFGSLTSCHSSVKKEVASPQKQQVLPSANYEVYLPKGPKPATGWPLLIAIDPHGSGKTAMKHLQEAVTNYPAILLASNQIQNNDPNYMQELNALIIEASEKFPINGQVYLAGFSGGARMALSYAGSHPIAGVIAAGAFASPGELRAIHGTVLGLIGMDDFNFSEAAQYLFQPDQLPSNTHIELTNASHEWPDADRMTNAWGWFRLADSSANKAELSDYVNRQQQRIDSLTKAGNLLQATCLDRNMGAVSSFNALFPFEKDTKTLSSSPAYQQQLAALGESLKTEMARRQQLTQALMENDENWWKSEIESLHQKATNEPDLIQRMAWKRLNGFLGIICYSYSRQLLARKDTEHLKQVLMVYRLAEPENPDMLHFSDELEKLQNWK